MADDLNFDDLIPAPGPQSPAAPVPPQVPPSATPPVSPAPPVVPPVSTPTLPAMPAQEAGPSFGSVLGQAGMRGIREGFADLSEGYNIAGRAAVGQSGFQDHGAHAAPDDHITKLLGQKVSEGWHDPQWWAAQIAHGLGKTSPSLAMGLAGGAAGTAVEPGLGTLVGGAAGFGVGGLMSTLAPAYQQARADGLNHEAAVDRALVESGIAGVFSTAMGLAPAAPVTGRTVSGALRRPVSEALAQIFGVQPAIGAAHQATVAAVEGKPVTADDLLTGYATNVGAGVGMVAGHRALSAMAPTRAAPRAEAERIEPWFGERSPVPDAPTAEPVADLRAQAGDLANPAHPRRGLWLSADNVAALSRDRPALAEVARSGVPIENFDGKGGVLIASDQGAAQWAVARRDAGVDPQVILGALTGAGEGKAPDATRVVQEVTPQGAVTRESAVAPQGVASTAERFSAEARASGTQGRGVRVVSTDQAIARREAGVAADGAPADPLPVNPGYAKQVERINQLRAERGEAALPEVVIRPEASPEAAVADILKAKTVDPSAMRKAIKWAVDNKRFDLIDALQQKATDAAATVKDFARDATAEPAPKGPAPVDILGFIRSKGGIRDETGDLKAMGGRERPGLINNRRGLSPDDMRALLVEGGYLRDAPHEDVTQSGVSDLYSAIDDALRGRKIYRPEDEAAADLHNRTRTRSLADEQEANAILAQLRDWHDESGLPYGLHPADEADIVARIREGTSLDDAIEQQAMAWYDEVGRHEAEGSGSQGGGESLAGSRASGERPSPEGVAVQEGAGGRGSSAESAGPGREAPQDALDFAVVTDPRTGKRHIEAYHGSPHDFDRFDMSKIGSGEGAQAYGRGLYFADSEAVAKSYRDTLSIDGLGVVARGRLRQFGGDIDKTIGYLRGRQSDGSDAAAVNGRQALHELERAKSIEGTKGRLYQVRIDADPDHFLDWDKPLYQQSDFVRSALEKAGVDTEPRGQYRVTPSAKSEKWTVRNAYGEAVGTFASKEAAEGTARFNNGSAQLAYMKLGGNAIYSHLDSGAASKALREAGVAGIRYFDQGSRGAGEGSHNYVVFDDSLVRITHKDGTPVSGSAREAALRAMGIGVDAPRPGRSWHPEAVTALGEPALRRMSPEAAAADLNGRFGLGLTAPDVAQKRSDLGYGPSQAERPTRLAAVRAALTMDRAVTVPNYVVKAGHEALRQLPQMAPEGTRVGMLARLEPVKGRGSTDTRATFTTPDGDWFTVEGPRSFLLSARAFRTTGDDIALLRLDAGGDLGRSLGGELGHEVVHVLRAQNRIPEETWGALVRHADALRLLDSDYRTYLQSIGQSARDMPAGVSGREIYHELYKGRNDFVDAMDQEAVAHMVELYHHRVLSDQEVAPVRRVLDQILSGEMARHPAGMVSGDGVMAAQGRAEVFDWSNPGGLGRDGEAAREKRIGATTITYGVGKNNLAEIILVKTDPSKRNQGNARTALEQFLGEADRNGFRVALTPDDTMGKGISKARLVDFYKSLGFKMNSGSSLDFTTRASMLREPRTDGHMAAAGAAPKRTLDPMGYYSGLQEAVYNLRQAKGTPEQMLAMLGKEGAKRGEIEATGLDKFLAGKQSVTKEEIAQFLEKNGVGINESVRWGGEKNRGNLGLAQFDNMTADDLLSALESPFTGIPTTGPNGPAKWSSYSLDPSNPTYRETVIHLPRNETPAERQAAYEAATKRYEAAVARQDAIDRTKQNLTPGDQAIINEVKAARDEMQRTSAPIAAQDFQSGHFPEPNIVGHMMTSMTEHQGKPVYTIDQIQSDWGQKLRDGGVRDEAKIAGLKQKLAEVVPPRDLVNEVRGWQERWTGKPVGSRDDWTAWQPKQLADMLRGNADAGLKQGTVTPTEAARLHKLASSAEDYQRLQAELRTAETATPGHPLVNTTDQWTQTTLRRAIRQAAEANADYIAIPHGDTVLSYNPGDEHGMRSFYGSRTSEGIVPKNLRKLLEKIDRGSAKPVRVDKLHTTQGLEGFKGDAKNRKSVQPEFKSDFDESQTGFTLFRLTDAVKKHVLERGLPVFSSGGRVEAPIPADTPKRSVLEQALRLAGITKNKS